MVYMGAVISELYGMSGIVGTFKILFYGADFIQYCLGCAMEVMAEPVEMKSLPVPLSCF
jgi:hypothetical protein